MKHHSFTLEHLEDRALFSVVGPMAAPPVIVPTAIHTISQTTVTPLAVFPRAFNVAGTYAHPIGPIGNPDTGTKYQFTGLGKTGTLGNFKLTGYVQTPGFVANGRTRGILEIINPNGRIYMSATGPVQAPGSLPASFSFLVYRGTGAYVHAAGKGTIAVSASGTTQKFVFRFSPTK